MRSKTQMLKCTIEFTHVAGPVVTPHILAAHVHADLAHSAGTLSFFAPARSDGVAVYTWKVFSVATP